MCRKFVKESTIESVAKEFKIERPLLDLNPSYNIAQNQDIAVIVEVSKGLNSIKEYKLQNAADLELIRDSSYRSNALSNIKVKVINSGAGHYLPTGLTELREMWFDVKIIDARGKIILRSGSLDKSGRIDRNAVKYYTKLGNRKGIPVLNFARADRILFDYRIPPK